MGPIPHRIKITHRVIYDVAWVDRFDDPKVVGECDYHRRQIRLLKSLNEEEAWWTFFHEVLHAMTYEHAHEVPLTESQVGATERSLRRIVKLNRTKK